MDIIATHLHTVNTRIHQAELQYGRLPGSVTLIAVSKQHPVSAIHSAYVAGQRQFAENYLQEALGKITATQDLDITWHFIGKIQSNKTSELAKHFDWIQSVDRLIIAKKLSEARPLDLPPLNICIQVNTSGETSKSGICLKSLSDFASSVTLLPRLQLRGLMCIPSKSQTFDAQRHQFKTVRAAFGSLQKTFPSLDTLSMGMSEDLEAAIAEYSTMVRIGTAIFGSRNYSKV